MDEVVMKKRIVLKEKPYWDGDQMLTLPLYQALLPEDDDEPGCYYTPDQPGYVFRLRADEVALVH